MSKEYSYFKSRKWFFPLPLPPVYSYMEDKFLQWNWKTKRENSWSAGAHWKCRISFLVMVGQVFTQLQLLDQYGFLKRGTFCVSSILVNGWVFLVSMYLSHDFHREPGFKVWLLVIESWFAHHVRRARNSLSGSLPNNLTFIVYLY